MLKIVPFPFIIKEWFQLRHVELLINLEFYGFAREVKAQIR